jgi:hypothetical protein
MGENKEFKWAFEEFKEPSEPVVGEIATVNLPVDVLFEWSDKIVAEVDENNEPVEYRSGYIMKVILPQTFVYEPVHKHRITKCFTTPGIDENGRV